MNEHNKILVVYNTCGISGKENSAYYIKAVNNLLRQDFDGYHIVVSSCCNSHLTRQNLINAIGDKVSYNFIDEVHPVNVTFNHSVRESVKRFGEFEGYLYVDSGTDVQDQTDIMSKLYKRLKTSNYGMVTPQPSTDTEYFKGLRVGRYRGDDEYAKQLLFSDGDYIIPIGNGMATHVNLISNKIRQYYGNTYPDIFAGHCTESTFSFINAALKLQWCLVHDIEIHQTVGLDGQSSGFDTMKWVASGRYTFEHPYKIKSILQRLVTQEALDIGFAYAEPLDIFPKHNKNQFNDRFHCINEELKVFIKDSLFLKSSELNYKEIKHDFIAS